MQIMLRSGTRHSARYTTQFFIHMRQSFAHLVAAPFLIAAMGVLYYAWTHAGTGALWLIVLLLPVAVIYVFAPQINWWWYSQRPPQLEAALVKMLEQHCAFYQHLSPACQQRFRERVALFRMGTEWTPMGWPEEGGVPPDVETAIAVQATIFNFAKQQLLFERFEKVIVYPIAFPSPEYPYPHASELYEPDGCIIFSAQHVVRALVQPMQYYNVALHEYAKAFHVTYPTTVFPKFDAPDVWLRLELVSGMPRAAIENFMDMAGLDVLHVALHHYFTFPNRFTEVFPAEAKALDQIFPKSCS